MSASTSLRIGKLRIDSVTQAEAVDRILELVRDNVGGRVFTPNIDHVVLAEDDARFADAYSRVTLSLADGFPIVVTSKLTDTPLPEKVSGSDLAMPLLERAAQAGLRVFLFGGGPGVAELARDKLLEKLPSLQIVGTASPQVSLSATKAELLELVAPIRESKAELVLVCLGAPKQEIFIDLVADELRPAVLLGLGASIDFLAGTMKRAPRWMSDNGLEWLYRLSRERGRLWKRYILRDSRYPLIVLKQRWAERGSRAKAGTSR